MKQLRNTISDFEWMIKAIIVVFKQFTEKAVVYIEANVKGKVFGIFAIEAYDITLIVCVDNARCLYQIAVTQLP